MATSVTAQKASQSLKGQDVFVYLNASDATTKLPNLTVGQVCTNGSSSYTGNISSIDYYGNSFKITPTMPDGNFSSSSTPGFLAASETISIA